jgi:cysteinyl-tRNA synthetase
MLLDAKFDIHNNALNVELHGHNLVLQAATLTNYQWVHFDFHNTDLTIDERIIKQAVEKLDERYIRYFCLMNLSPTLTLSNYNIDEQMGKLKSYEEIITDFCDQVKKICSLTHHQNNKALKFDQVDLTLLKFFGTIKKEIHNALCNCIDTSTAMNNLVELIQSTNNYIKTCENINLVLLQLIEKYVIHLMNALGLDPSSTNDTYGSSHTSPE